MTANSAKRTCIPLLTALALIALALVIGSCAPAATEVKESLSQTEAPAVEEPVPEEPREQLPEGESVSPTSLPPPTRTEDSAIGEEPELPAEPLTASPIAQQPIPATPIATAPSLPTLTPIIEERLMEIEWPPAMRLGESDVVRLALIPSQDGYIVQAEYPEHQVVTETLKVERPGGYDLYALARLDGVAFEIAPSGDQSQYMAPEQPIAWRWSLTPQSSGQQRLVVHLTLRWEPTAEGAVARQVEALSQGLDVNVISFFGLSQLQAFSAGLFGLVFGGGLSLFALVILRPRGIVPLIQVREPNPALTIELPPGVALIPHERAILQSLFQRYGRLVVKDEFLSGYSGARTFLTLPVRPDGRADAYTIAKLGERLAIEREYENFEIYVKDTLPPITARIQRPPVTTSAPTQGLQLGALQYTFIGQPGSGPTSLRQALLESPDTGLLEKLFDTFGPNWWMQRRPYTFRMGQEYDRLLPTHLVVEPADGRGQVLRPDDSPAGLDLAVGDLVNLHGFTNFERRADGRSLSLRGIGTPGQPVLRVRWLSPEPPHGVGRVIDTRWTLLRKYCAEADLYALPDPISRLPEWLNEAITGGRSTIHGDLNVENVLVGPGGLVWLIDFAQTRDGHTLYDFAHLEAEIVAHVIAPQIHDPQAYLDLLENPEEGPYTGLLALRQTVQSIATRCLFNPSKPAEYQLALTLACLGALKFANIDQHARHFLYLTAAYQAQSL